MNPPAQSVARAGARRWIGWVSLFAVAFGLRLAVVLQYETHHPHADQPVIDEASYERWAREIAAGDWVGEEVFFQEPLYPYALAVGVQLFGPARLPLRIVQALLGALTALLVAGLARRLFGGGAGWLAGYAFALHRAALLLPCLFLKPNLFLPLLALLALVLTRAGPGPARRWIGIGVLVGLGALLRGNMLVLGPLFVAWPLGHAFFGRAAVRAAPMRAAPMRAALLRSGAALGGLALVLLPVALRNQAVGGVFALSTSGAGTNLYGGNNEHNPRGLATEFPWVRGVPEHEADDWRREAQRRAGRELDPGEVSSFWTAELRDSLRARPGMHARILWNKLRLSLGSYEVPDNHDLEWDARYVPLLRLPWPGFALTGALGLAGLFVFLAQAMWSRSERTRRRLDLAVLFAAYLATIVLTVTSMRARLPLVVLLAPFAGAFVAGAAGSLRFRAGREPWTRVALPLALGLVITCTPVLPPTERERARLGRDHNLAVQRIEAGQLDEAAKLARELLEQDPANPRFATLLADVEWREGQLLRHGGEEQRGRQFVRSALERLEAVVRGGLANPRERARAHRLAGWIQLDLSAHAAAERHFRRAREFAGDDPDFVFEHLQALVLLVESTPPGTQRDARGAEAALLIEALRADGAGGQAVDDLAARL